jgi:hypothetical protein
MGDDKQATSTKAPVGIGWRVEVAREAVVFFGIQGHAAGLEALGKSDPPQTVEPFTVLEFIRFLGTRWGGKEPWPLVPHIERVLARLVAVGLLDERGIGSDLQRAYLRTRGITRSQANGNLWLSEALGPELIVPSYGSVSVAITGTDSSGDACIGTGLLVGPNQILTAAHVVSDMTLDEQVNLPVIAPPIVYGLAPWKPSTVTRTHVHDEVDVAVIEVEEPMMVLGGIAFRDPAWSDRTTVFGYPPIPYATDSHLVVQTGEVVNPGITTLDAREVFLFSATARPGNSGGAIVGADGRVLGLVTQELGMKDAPESTPFYAGVPTGVIVNAVTDLGFPELLTLEDWS